MCKCGSEKDPKIVLVGDETIEVCPECRPVEDRMETLKTHHSEWCETIKYHQEEAAYAEAERDRVEKEMTVLDREEE